MKQLAILLSLVVCASAYSQVPPDDSGKYHVVTVVSDPPTPLGASLAQSFRSHPDLAPIYERCKRFQFKTSDPLYRARYATSLPPTNLPIVALVRSDGGVIYKASGANIPPPDTLAAQLLSIATIDRAANATRSTWRPDGSRLPNVLPLDGGLIPDTVDVHHDVNFPPGPLWAGLGIVLFLLLGGLCFFGIVAGLILLMRGD